MYVHTSAQGPTTTTRTHGQPASSVYTHGTLVCVGKSLRKCTYAAKRPRHPFI